jgi:heterodisulfide reductase subunit A
LVAPRQQELLQDKNISLLTLAEIKEVKGSYGKFTVKIHKKARFVNMDNCIGCDACFEPCPVSIKNEFEEGLSLRKAIYVPCAGALPNVPMIDTEHCLRFTGKTCTACQEACMFEAIEYDQKDEELNLNVGSIIVATGFQLMDLKELKKFGYGKFDAVYTAMEFERLYASNGPTNGEIVLRNGQTPKKIAIIHCVGREEKGYCSSVCCLYSLKFNHYLKSKLTDVSVSEFYTDLSIPGKSHQKFYEKIKDSHVKFIRYRDIELSKRGNGIAVQYTDNKGEKNTVPVDMVILAPAIEPGTNASALAEILGITLDSYGFFKETDIATAAIESSKKGIFIAGCAQGAKNIQDSVAQANAAVGQILAVSANEEKTDG